MNILSLFAQLDSSNLPHPQANQAALNVALNIVFAIAGSIALLMIVIGGFRYIVADGDPNSMSGARKTILYAVIGLLVTISAYSIVTLVVKRVG